MVVISNMQTTMKEQMRKQRSARRRKVKDDATVASGTSMSTITCDDLSGFDEQQSRHDKRRSAPGSMLRNLQTLQQQQQSEFRPREQLRKQNSTRRCSSASFDLPLMEDDSDSIHMEMEAPRTRALSTRNLMASEEPEASLEQVECGFRPRASVSCLDFGNTLTALDVSMMSAKYDDEDTEEEEEEEEDEEEEFQAETNVGEQDETYLKKIECISRRSTFAKNMDFITTRGSYFAQNVDYVQARTERLTRSIGGIFTLGRFSEEDKKTEGEILSFLDIGTKVEVLEVMYSPEQVAQVLKRLHVRGARRMR